MNRKIFASRETEIVAKTSKSRRVEVYSFFPVDRANCACKDIILQYKEKFASLPGHKVKAIMQEQGHLTCPADKVGMRRYVITCKNCGEVLGYCWATDNTLKDWCDFHYASWSDGKEWRGCFTPHISPITEELCLECCCGQDTRDFRANTTLPSMRVSQIEQSNKVGRKFGQPSSKFATRVIGVNVLPFRGKRRAK